MYDIKSKYFSYAVQLTQFIVHFLLFYHCCFMLPWPQLSDELAGGHSLSANRSAIPTLSDDELSSDSDSDGEPEMPPGRT